VEKLSRKERFEYAQGVRKPIDADSLPANRAGRLTATQQRRLEEADRRTAWITGIAGAAAFVVAVVALASPLLELAGLAPGAGFAVGFAAVVALIALIAFAWRLRRKVRDVRAGLVTSLEGPISKRVARGGEADLYYVTVGAKRFQTSDAKFASLPATGRVRLFVLPRSNEIVNFEPLDAAAEDPSAR
jgi:hypothetical protein